MNNPNHSPTLAARVFAAALLLTGADSALSAAHFVDLTSASPTPPYTNWATAATSIQDAVDASVPGDEIVVTNGIYATGGRDGNRVAVDKALSLRSINGPQSTTIDGAHSNRCAYLTNGASLFGFTLTNGRAHYGGGLWCESTNAVASNCVVSGNSTFGEIHPVDEGIDPFISPAFAGGVVGGTLDHCMLSGNRAETYYYHDFLGHYYSRAGVGGGAGNATLNHCTLTGNSAGYGGGAAGCLFNNCTLTGNSGGGAYGSTLNNCTLTGNSGSGADVSALNNCTLTGNSGGGATSSTLKNCLVYFNGAQQGANYDPSSTLNYCCTTPQPTNGVGNISLDPRLASSSHLSSASPCRRAGNAAYASGVDLDGESWASPPSIGCDEYHAGALTGPLSVAIAASFTNVAMGFTVQLTAMIEGRAAASSWDFGDGIAATNQPYSSHAWTVPGDYTVVLRAFNESQLGGIPATLTVHVVDGVYYVAADSGNPVAPYTSWATAATNIQDAVDAAIEPGALVLVNNGIYATGGRAVYGTTNRVVLDKLLTVRSVKGPLFTTIDGGQSIRCVYLTDSAILSGFTLTNGTADVAVSAGGGVFCESPAGVVSNCVMAGNSASFGGGSYGGTLNNCTLSSNSAAYGGGAGNSTLNNCRLIGNSASGGGGGARDSTLNNCTLTGNSATGYSVFGDGGGATWCTLNNCTITGNRASHYGGGTYGCRLNNCTIYYNTAQDRSNYDGCTLNYSCTTPQPTGGVGNISLDPQLASASHLSGGSRCRSAGNAAYASGTDIDHETWASPPSIGCDEYRVGALTGPLRVAITASFTNVPIGFTVQLTALIEGRIAASSWNFGDGIEVTNQPYTSHAWTVAGDHAVVLRAFNESQPGGISATVTVHVVGQPIHYVAADGANPVAPYTSWATAATNIQDAVDAAMVPGALVLVTNGAYATGGRAVDGTTNRIVIDKPLTVRSVNGPESASIHGERHGPHGFLGMRCAYLTKSATLSGFSLTNGVSHSGGGAFGGTLDNCTLAGNSASYGGGGAYGCTLNNCTITGNSGSYAGGGARDSTLNNCTLTGNSAGAYHGSGGGAYVCILNHCTLTGNSAIYGGGASWGTLNNCTLTGNRAYADQDSGGEGGGAAGCTLNNCTLTGNSADDGGGAAEGTLNNCIVYFNTSTNGANYYSCTLSYSCTTPQPTGLGNITTAPLFVDLASGNLRLQSNSPCINAGRNTFAPAGLDLNGNPRIDGGTVDIGAYEFQSPTSIISYAWLQQYALPTDGSADSADPDGDGLNNWREWRCRTNPTNALSALRLLAPVTRSANVSVTWESIAGVTYFLERGTNLAESPAFTPRATNLPGQPATTTYMDPTAIGAGPWFYRVGVSTP